MNRIKFNNGGQPLFLEDIKLLQDNQDEMIKSLLYALCKDKNVLIQGGELEGDDNTVFVTGGKAFIAGDIVVWDDIEIDEYLLDERDLYLCVKDVEEDEREFGDGFNRNCRLNKVVYISNTTTGAIGYVDLYNRDSFAYILKGVLGFSSSSYSWIEEQFDEQLVYNGFDIELYYQPVSGGIQVKLRISSQNAAWDDRVEGVICSYPGELATQLQGAYSPAIFIGGDGEVYSDIIEWSRDGNNLCLLDADGGAVKHTPYGKIESQFVIYI